jgi:hypothetical protein
MFATATNTARYAQGKTAAIEDRSSHRLVFATHNYEAANGTYDYNPVEITLTRVVVPETPPTLMLLAFGLAGLACAKFLTLRCTDYRP